MTVHPVQAEHLSNQKFFCISLLQKSHNNNKPNQNKPKQKHTLLSLPYLLTYMSTFFCFCLHQDIKSWYRESTLKSGVKSYIYFEVLTSGT